jgi:hypothetical protein
MTPGNPFSCWTRYCALVDVLLYAPPKLGRLEIRRVVVFETLKPLPPDAILGIMTLFGRTRTKEKST